MNKILALLFLSLAFLASVGAHADGMETDARILGADCVPVGTNPGFTSIISRVDGNQARVWIYNGPRNPVNSSLNMTAAGGGQVYSMVGFPHETFETVVIKLDESLQKITKLPRLTLSAKIKKPNPEMTASGYLSNPMTEEEDISLRCFITYEPTSEDLFKNNPDYVQPATHPALCSIEYKDRYVHEFTHGCTATVIGDNKLLSAAHCQESFAAKENRVRCGNDPTWRKILRWEKNPAYRPSAHPIAKSEDISVLTLDSTGSAPALSVESDTLAVQKMILENRNCRHYGMGTRQDGSIGNLFVSKYHEPAPLLGGYDFVRRIFEMTEMIASDPARFMRPGDSGGPIVCENDRGQDTIVGVHSFISTASNSALSAMTSLSWEFIRTEIER